MKIKLLISSLLATSLGFSQFNTQNDEEGVFGENIYFGIGYGSAVDGIRQVTDAVNVDQIFSVEIGLQKRFDKFSYAISAELLYANGSESFEGDDVESRNFGGLLNLTLAFHPVENVSVFVGAGFGGLDHSLEFSGVEFEESVFIWTTKIGLEFKATQNLALVAQYRYIWGEDFENLNFTAIQDGFIEVAARYYF